MAKVELLNRMYHAILEWFVEHGRAPHYVELAHRLELAVEETRRNLPELVDMGLPGVWQHPGLTTSNPSHHSLTCRRST
jgi:hypothetical protein